MLSTLSKWYTTVPSDQVHLIHAEGEAVASYPGHMGGELGSIATAKKEADCFSVAVLTQLQYSFVIAYPECKYSCAVGGDVESTLEFL